MEAWQNFLIQQEAELGSEIVHKWLKPLKVVRFDARNLYLKAHDAFQITWFEEHIRKKLKKFVNNNKSLIKVHLELDQSLSEPKKTRKVNPDSSPPQTSINFDGLDPSCSFDNYLGSQSNELPLRVLRELIESKRVQYNPIYLYGPEGAGKTHLLMAVAHALQAKQSKVAYVRAETFTEHVVSAIRAGEMRQFRQSYRNVDVLIIDDLHIFAKKWATQEELFHTFNTLHIAGKQMILSANCVPSLLPFIEPRLVSRFEWGLILSLTQPSQQDMEQILTSKIKAMNYRLNSKVIEFLLQTFKSSSKALVGAIEALALRSHLKNEPDISVALAEKILQDLIASERQSELTPETILQQIVSYFGIRVDDVLGKAQTRDCVLPRQLAMYLCRTQLNLPYTKIAQIFERDHSTIMSGVKQVQKGVDQNKPEISEPLLTILNQLHTLSKKVKS